MLADGLDSFDDFLLHGWAGMAQAVGIVAKLLFGNPGFFCQGFLGYVTACVLE